MTSYDPEPAADLLERVGRLQLHRHVTELAIAGHTVLPDILTTTETTRLRARAVELLTSSAAVHDPCGRRVWNLLRHDSQFTRLLTDPQVEALLTYLVGRHALLSSLHINAVDPGAPAQDVHHDTPFVPAPLPQHPLVANTIWCLDDWQPRHGATEVLSGSHLAATHPPADPTGLTAVECPAGSVIVTNGNLWHRSGAHADRTGTSRIGILALYCRRYVTPQETYTDIAATLANGNALLAARLGVDAPYPFGPSGPDQRFGLAQASSTSPFG